MQIQIGPDIRHLIGWVRRHHHAAVMIFLITVEIAAISLAAWFGSGS